MRNEWIVESHNPGPLSWIFVPSIFSGFGLNFWAGTSLCLYESLLAPMLKGFVIFSLAQEATESEEYKQLENEVKASEDSLKLMTPAQKTSLAPIFEYRRSLLFAYSNFEELGQFKRASVALGCNLATKALSYPLTFAFTQMLFVHIRGAPDAILDTFSTLPSALKFIFDETGFAGLYQGFGPVVANEILRALVIYGTSKSATSLVKTALKSSEQSIRDVTEMKLKQRDDIAAITAIFHNFVGNNTVGTITSFFGKLMFPQFATHLLERLFAWFSVNARLAPSLDAPYILPTLRDFVRTYVCSFVTQDLSFVH
eukprot:TRINITY_DN969_c0_g1_i2.p1 TRINITY_DN969_c0_g1~~TRINITY_DN969_c0_g1_i2.p1  ORF type:complete len:313 (+),score=51.11 TRINITY_DN969_c0_g1_i2:215-1153(+)